MTYDPSQPRVSDSPAVSAPFIQTNFAEYAAIFSRLVAGVIYNHMPFNAQHQGKHAAVLLENQSADPGVTQDLTILYNKNATSAVSTEPQLFAQIPKFLPTPQDTDPGPNIGMQLTYNNVDTAGPQYHSFLIGGYLIYIGEILPVVGNVTVTLVPTPSEILTVQQMLGSTVPVTVTQPNKFTIQGIGGNHWVVIAKA